MGRRRTLDPVEMGPSSPAVPKSAAADAKLENIGSIIYYSLDNLRDFCEIFGILEIVQTAMTISI